MKTIFNNPRCWILLYFVVVGVWAKAQDDALESYIRVAGDYAAMYQGTIETPYDRAQWIGDPYLYGEEWKTGDVSYNGILYTGVKIRVNIARQELIVATPNKRVSVAPDVSKVDYFVIDGNKYLCMKGKVVRVDYDGENIKLLYQKRKVRGTDVWRGMHSYNTFAIEESYYVAVGDSLVKVRKLRHVLKALPFDKDAIKSYVKANSSIEASDKDKMSLAVAEANRRYRPVASPIVIPYDTVAYSDSQLLLEEAPQPVVMIALDTHRHKDWEYEDGIDYDSENPGIGDFEQITEDKILDEVVVRGVQERVSTIHVGMEKFRPSLLKNLPLALGEADVMKMIQTMPGIKSVGEASSGYNVRGGASDQNLILFNNATIYNPMHLFGVFSAFNSDMINDAELYKSGIPSQYGGRISSVLNITPKMADKNNWHGQVSVSLLTSKATIEAPIIKDKLSLLVSGRTTYSDWMLGLLPESSGYQDGNAGFYDLGSVLSWNVNSEQRINAYGYYSHDRFSFSRYDKYAYSNRNMSVDWRAMWNENLTSIISAGSDHYDYYNDDTAVETEAARLSFAIDQTFLKAVMTHVLDGSNSLKYGLNLQYYNISPGKYEPLGSVSNITTDEIEKDKALESALFVEDTWKGIEKLTINGGVRLSAFKSLFDGKGMTDIAPELRLSISYAVADKQSVKLGFNSMHQYIHKVSNSLIMSPTDIWKLSDSDIKPQSGWQIAGGYFASVKEVEISVEGYVKRSENYLTYKNAGRLLMNHELHNDVVGTNSKAYGVEVQVRKPTGRINGWISYGYSRAFQQDTRSEYPINNGEWFAAEHDRPHEFKVVSNFKFTHRYSLSCNVDYSSGRPTTIPVGQYYDQVTQRWNPYYTKRNDYRMPYYFRTDLSFNIEPNHHITQKVHSSISLGVYNLTGRRNSYSVYYQVETRKIQGYSLSIFGAPVPFVTYNIKF